MVCPSWSVWLFYCQDFFLFVWKVLEIITIEWGCFVVLKRCCPCVYFSVLGDLWLCCCTFCHLLFFHRWSCSKELCCSWSCCWSSLYDCRLEGLSSFFSWFVLFVFVDRFRRSYFFGNMDDWELMLELFFTLDPFSTFSSKDRDLVCQFCRSIFFLLIRGCEYLEISCLWILDFLGSAHGVGESKVLDIFEPSKADRDRFLLGKEAIRRSFQPLRIQWTRCLWIYRNRPFLWEVREVDTI